MSTNNRKLGEPVITEMTDTEAAMMDALTATTESDLATGTLHTTLRWNREQLDVVRCAAERYGMPYQTYVKDAAFRRALEDLRRLGEPSHRSTAPA
jgi:predicted DNA binding CopG/RHH family protein